MSLLALDAEALYLDLRARVQDWLAPRDPLENMLVGVWSGGAWLAERLHRDLGLPGRHGVVSSTLHRDDFGARGLAATTDPTSLPFEIENLHVLLVDDVLFTGRTTRAAINELFDFGRPASVTLAVLVDRGGRELPIEAAISAARIALPPAQRLALGRDAEGRFSFDLQTLA
ncbi:bifunctional pyr operon transcriptional regulator/uracil phosphoribosyltransferase PyrR [Piscinibacter sp. Jin2]|uniref:Bifunctional pyr operon transcriptional regulator/uracil phosphoribosyltransferase PyrR n=1 Tax=Aquariibacter lacus TaxID=2801332 RepID=A0A9X0XJ88_9BURK|nr:bifunctional pyr operon transcriptional regulator/uracil phosphoribosyltransferase PyrR [Piscinibacter lacus]MBL0720470.1 bifunctional pyr operon transcriptional regulator/uracil phosphoribosyltransferase PyrR [Piscinibacter lacus]